MRCGNELSGAEDIDRRSLDLERPEGTKNRWGDSVRSVEAAGNNDRHPGASIVHAGTGAGRGVSAGCAMPAAA